MKREIKIDKAIYIADEATKTYDFLNTNATWEKSGIKQNNKINNP